MSRAAELREFVYLDEVSVYSLIASRLGPIATEFTETETASLQREIAGSLSADSGVMRAEFNPRRIDIQTQGSQVLRKSIVQTTFKELYDLEIDSLTIRPMPEDAKPPEIHNINDLIDTVNLSEHNGWIVDPEELTRGRLLEAEVQLEAESIFQVSAVISAFLEIFEGNLEMFGLSFHEELVEARYMERIIAKLLVGLVPIRGHVVDYEVVRFGEKKWIVHRKLLNQLPTATLPPTHPLFVVGVAEQSLFWKDIRRILFSKARFRVLCRIAQDGLKDSWTPIKLAQVIGLVMPDIASQIEKVGASIFATMAGTNTPNQSTELKKQQMRDALVGYATLLADHYGHYLNEQDSSEINRISEQYCNSHGSQKERRESFEAIATFVLNRFGIEKEPYIIANYRGIALTDAGFHFSGKSLPLATSSDPSPSATPSEERLLDAEFIAIYW